MRKKILIIFAAILATVSLAACNSATKTDSDTASANKTTKTTGDINSTSGKFTSSNDTTQPKDSTDSENDSSENYEWTAYLYYPDESSQYVVKTETKFRYTDIEPGNEEKAGMILEKMIGSQNTAIPQGTKVLSVVQDNDMITVDFSKEFNENMNGGSTAINMMMSQIVLSITELDGINKVSITVEGEFINEYKGHIELNRPFTRDEYLNFIA